MQQNFVEEKFSSCRKFALLLGRKFVFKILKETGSLFLI